MLGIIPTTTSRGHRIVPPTSSTPVVVRKSAASNESLAPTAPSRDFSPTAVSSVSEASAPILKSIVDDALKDLRPSRKVRWATRKPMVSTAALPPNSTTGGPPNCPSDFDTGGDALGRWNNNPYDGGDGTGGYFYPGAHDDGPGDPRHLLTTFCEEGEPILSLSEGLVDMEDLEVRLKIQLADGSSPDVSGKVLSGRNYFLQHVPNVVWSLVSPLGISAPAKRVEERKIITQISGSFLSGRLVALLGPSGAGKTTLLNVLAGRVVHTSGTMRFNGEVVESSDAIRRASAFIQQVDLFNARLTVQEHLEVQIRLRAPHLSKEQQTKLCRRLLARFTLRGCAGTVIGTMGNGISGGERKRVSVATEVVNNPQLMLADEPTTGLDSTMAASVVAALRTLADSNRAVIASLHQPSSQVFNLFDEVLLLSEGRLLYFGDRLGSVEWFRRLGYPCPKLANPADFLLCCVSPPEAPAAAKAAKIDEIHQMATAWATDGESFTTWWAQQGRHYFYRSSRCFVERNITALLLAHESPAESECTSFAVHQNGRGNTGSGAPKEEASADGAAFDLLADVKQDRQQLETLQQMPITDVTTTETNIPAEGLILVPPPEPCWRAGIRGDGLLSPHSAPVECQQLREKVDLELQRVFAHRSPRMGRRSTTHCAGDSSFATPVQRGICSQPAPVAEDDAATVQRRLALMSRSPPTFGRPSTAGKWLTIEEEEEEEAAAVYPEQPQQMAEGQMAENGGGGLSVESSSLCSDVWRDLMPVDTAARPATWTEQFSVLLWREFRALTRDHILLHARVAQMLLVGTVLTSIFWRLGESESDSRAKLSAIFFLICNQGLVAAIGVCSTFTQEKVVAQREIEAGVTQVTSYVVAKITSDIPAQTLLPAVFTAICYWGMNLGQDWSTFGGMLLVTILVSWSAISIGYLGSVSAQNSDEALMFAQIWAIPALLFAGFVINLSEIPKPLQWMQYVSYFRYGYMAYTYLAFHGREVLFKRRGFVFRISGDKYVESYLGYSVTSPAAFWRQIGFLVVLLVVFRSLVILVAVPASRKWHENRR